MIKGLFLYVAPKQIVKSTKVRITKIVCYIKVLPMQEVYFTQGSILYAGKENLGKH